MAEQSSPAPFVQKQTAAISARATSQLKEHSLQCLSKYFSNESLLGRGQVYQAELESEQGPVKAAGAQQHPLLAFLATPKLPPELAQYLDR
jgi:hypothetical protein